MGDLLEMTETEIEHLTWIHSNKFTIPELFHKKFIQPKTYRLACHILRNQYLKKGFLDMTKAEGSKFQDSMYFLTVKAIKSLDARNQILVRGTNYPVKVNPYERDHDLKVQELRIAIEASKDLEDVFWVSDFEMRSGIWPSVKAQFIEGKLDKEKWRSQGMNPNPKGRRTPDGYFEADLEGKREGFTLEFENLPYNDRMLNRMADNLKDHFSNATKLVVSDSRKNAIRMIKALQWKIKDDEKNQWFVSDFEKVITMPFKEIWHQVNHPLEDS